MAATPTPENHFTGRPGRHKTRWTVRLTDRVSSWVITVGGIGTIVAICLVFVCLLWVVVPLFRSAKVSDLRNLRSPALSMAPLEVAIDEYRVLGWSLHTDGTLLTFRLDNGEVLETQNLLGKKDVAIADVSYIGSENHLVIARSDGQLMVGKIGFKPGFLAKDNLPPGLSRLAPGEVTSHAAGVVQRTAQGEYRTQALDLAIQKPLPLSDAPLKLVHHAITSTGIVVAGWTTEGQLVHGQLRERLNFATGKQQLAATIRSIPTKSSRGEAPGRLFVPGQGDNIYLVWDDGQLDRYDVRSPQQPSLAESIKLLPDGIQATVTAVDFVIGQETLLVGDSQGGLRAWFLVRHSDAQTSDGRWLLPVHTLPYGKSPVREFGISERSRMAAVGYDSGHVRVVQVTMEELLLDEVVASGRGIEYLVFAPKDDALYAGSDGTLWEADFTRGVPRSHHGVFLSTNLVRRLRTPGSRLAKFVRGRPI